MIKLVVFDWNGVLIADAQANADTVNKILAHYGRRPINLKVFREIFQIPSRHIYLSQGFSEKEVAREWKHIQEMLHDNYEPRITHVRTRHGARQLLQWLASRHSESVIVSNHTVEGICAQLERLDLTRYFSKVLANDRYQAMKGQNKLEKLEKFLRGRRFTKGEVVIIGDSAEEIEVGKHLCIHTVGITGGYVSTSRLRKAKPDYLITNLTQMPGVIKKL